MLPNEKLTETLAEQNEQATTPVLSKKFFNFSFGGDKKNKQLNLDTSALIRRIYPLTIVLIVAILIWFFAFLYNNFYLTMTQAEVVSNLKIEVAASQLNQAKFNEIIKNIEAKAALANWNRLSSLLSPFNFGARNNYINSITTSTTPLPATSTPLTTTSSTLTTVSSTKTSTTPIKISSTTASTKATTTSVASTSATTTKK